MPPPPDIALKLLLDDTAFAQYGFTDGSHLTLAWHNLFVVNHLALVSKLWHSFVIRYKGCNAVAAVLDLFAFAARTYKVGLLSSRRRNELPIGLQFRDFTDQVFDNVCAISKQMLKWRSRRPKQELSSPPSISYGPNLCVRGDWLSLWRPHHLVGPSLGMFMLHRSTSVPHIQENWTPTYQAMLLRRCRSTQYLAPMGRSNDDDDDDDEYWEPL